jgi:sugar transferase EpsL
MIYRRIIKPLSDCFLAGIGLILLSPVLLAVGIAVRGKMNAPAIFKQQRIGLNERPFQFLKFRTMTDQKDAAGKLLSDELRLTRLGRFLRASSLDELPQLWNVIRGDMSLIGPRPLLPEYLPRYSVTQRRRHEVKPGITGLAQALGRNSISWERKFELDVAYVDRCSLLIDARILWLSLISVIRRDGISQAGHATVTEFMGSASASHSSHTDVSGRWPNLPS